MASLYIKYRPKTFEEIVGNTTSIKTLQKLLTKESHPHVWLFSGPPGTGKTTTARIVANFLGASEFDIKEINTANNRGIETARQIMDESRYSATGGSYIVYIIDEMQKATNDYQNAMLKILEDTPNHIYFILCTTDPSKLIKAVKSRCTEIKFNSLPINEMLVLLKKINKLEKLQVSIETLEKISENCEGSPRNALILLEKVSQVETEKEADEIIRSGNIDDDKEIIELARALIDTRNQWADIAKILKGLNESGKLDDTETVRYIILGYMNSILLSGKTMKRAMLALEAFQEPTYNSKKAGITLACINTIIE